MAFWELMTGIVQAEEQLASIEAACAPHMKDEDRHEVIERHREEARAVEHWLGVEKEAEAARQRQLEAQWARNREALRRALGG